MDLKKIGSLPKLLHPRTGKLAMIRRSKDELTPYEEEIATEQFDKFDIDQKVSLEKSEIPTL